MGGVPEGVTLEHWDGSEPLPSSAPDVAWVVPSPVFKDGHLLEGLPSLEVVQILSAGYDWLHDTRLPGVTVCNAGDANAASVADWICAVVLADVRMLDDFRALQAEARWERRLGPSMDTLTVLVVGYGAIGRAVGARLRAFGCTVVPVAGRARPEEGVHAAAALDDLLPDAHVVVLLTPLSAATHHLMGADRLARLRDGALLVNAARGPVVHTEALLAELHSGRIRAALDVTDPEPLPADHPLWQAPGVRITPHIAGGTRDFFRFTYPVVRAQLERAVRGEPLANVVRAPQSP